MNAANPLLTLEHPEYGRLPALRLLDCIFALTPDEAILHFHREQVTPAGEPGVLQFTGAMPQEDRKRCRVIPPFVVAFRKAATESPA